MISPLRHTKTTYFLTLMLVLVFLCVSLWQSSHVHHQHGSADAGLTFGHISFVSGFSAGPRDDAEPHGEHNHDAPDKTTHLYKHNTGWKTLRGKADGGNQFKMPAVFSTRDIAILTPDAGTSQVPYAMGDSGAWIGGRPPARAPPAISSFS